MQGGRDSPQANINMTDEKNKPGINIFKQNALKDRLMKPSLTLPKDKIYLNSDSSYSGMEVKNYNLSVPLSREDRQMLASVAASLRISLASLFRASVFEYVAARPFLVQTNSEEVAEENVS